MTNIYRRARMFFLAVLLCCAVAAALAPPLLAAPKETPAVCPASQTFLKTDTEKRVCCPKGSEADAKSCFFGKYLNPTIKVLSIIAGLAVVIGIVMGGIQYSASGGDPQKTAAAKGKVVKALYSLLAFLFLYSALQFLSPGGIGTQRTPTGSGRTVAAQCSKPFLGIKPWFAYLPNAAFNKQGKTTTCDIENFTLFGSAGNGSGSYIVPVLLAITDGLIRVAGMIAVVFVITGGVRFVTSSGEPDKTKQARETILHALVGLGIAIIASAVVSYVGNNLS